MKTILAIASLLAVSQQSPADLMQQFREVQSVARAAAIKTAPSMQAVIKDAIKPAADQVKGVASGVHAAQPKAAVLGIQGLNYTNANYCYPAGNNNVVCYVEPQPL